MDRGSMLSGRCELAGALRRLERRDLGLQLRGLLRQLCQLLLQGLDPSLLRFDLPVLLLELIQ